MRAGRVAALVLALVVVIGAIYWFTSYEDAGTTMLVASSLLGLLAGGYLLLQSRRFPPRPEDRPDATLAEGAGPVIQGGGELAGDRGGTGGCALRPGGVVSQVGQGEPLESAVQHAGDGPGAVHRRGGDPVDEGVDVVAGELGGA